MGFEPMRGIAPPKRLAGARTRPLCDPSRLETNISEIHLRRNANVCEIRHYRAMRLGKRNFWSPSRLFPFVVVFVDDDASTFDKIFTIKRNLWPPPALVTVLAGELRYSEHRGPVNDCYSGCLWQAHQPMADNSRATAIKVTSNKQRTHKLPPAR